MPSSGRLCSACKAGVHSTHDPGREALTLLSLVEAREAVRCPEYGCRCSTVSQAAGLTNEGLMLVRLARVSQSPLWKNPYSAPPEATQEALAPALRISRAHAAIILRRLESAGKVSLAIRRPQGGKVRRKVYMLTRNGIGAAKAFVERVPAAWSVGAEWTTIAYPAAIYSKKKRSTIPLPQPSRRLTRIGAGIRHRTVGKVEYINFWWYEDDAQGKAVKRERYLGREDNVDARQEGKQALLAFLELRRSEIARKIEAVRGGEL